ncbi:transposase, MuDR, MULE transposase domain protein [Tanacetum coccineum]
MVRQKAILDLVLQFDNACTTKEDLRKAYEKCNDIPQESHGLIDTFLKEGSDKDYEPNLSMYGKAAKIEKQMNAKLVWLLEKYKYRSQTHIGSSSSQTHEICDLYLTDKELHQLHLDEEALRETLEEAAIDEKAREERIRQKQVDDDEFFFRIWGVVKDVGKDDDFKSGSWVSATNYVNAFGGSVTGCLGDIKNFLKNGKLDQVVAIVKSCSSNVLGDLTVTIKDLSSTIPGTISHKVIDEGGYGKDITVGAAMILANISVFTPKPSKHYLNITMRNVVERNDVNANKDVNVVLCNVPMRVSTRLWIMRIRKEELMMLQKLSMVCEFCSHQMMAKAQFESESVTVTVTEVRIWEVRHKECGVV